MRFLFGRGWTFCDETDGNGDGNGDAGGGDAGAGDAGGDAGDVAGADAGADDAGAAGEKDDGQGGDKGDAAGEPKSMEEAIAQGLAKTAPKVEKTEPEKAAEAKAAAAAAVVAAGKHANGTPKKNDKGEDLDDAGKVVPKAAPKAKTAAELELKPEEKKLLGAKANARVSEIITTLKTREAEIATLTEQMKPLAEARDSIIGIMKETGTSSDTLAAYLEFNRMLGSNDPKQLEAALDMVENQRAALYTALGREPEGGGVDLLADFADLKEKVAEGHMTREAALEVAAARRQTASNDARLRQEGQQRQSAQQAKQAQDNALKDITAWTTDLGKKDIDFKAKEERLLEQVDEVIKNYPPKQWLATLKLLYSQITVSKQTPPGSGQKPIRPSGAKPGAKAPQNMFEAMWGSKAG